MVHAAVLALILTAAGPFPNPGEPSLAFVDRERLEWNAVPFARLWNVYRGDLQALRATGEYSQLPGTNGLALQACGRNVMWYEDPVEPLPGETAFYLVTLVVTTTELTLGDDSSGVQRSNDHRCSEGYFCVADAIGDSFVLKVADTQDLNHARLVAYGFNELAVHISGQVAFAVTVPWNPGWNFHVIPETVGYFEASIEVCDAAIAWVNQFGGPAGGSWCPWSSMILYELPVPEQTEPDGIPPQPCGSGGGP